MRWRLDDLEVLCAIAEAGGITGAARRLDLPKSTVSKLLSRLEQGLGVRLIERSSRRVAVTSEGEAFIARASLILDMAHEADAMMQGLLAVPTGRVTLAAPAAFAREVLTPRLHDFARRYPQILLDLVVTSHPAEGIGERCDMAVVAGMQPDSSLSQKVLLGGQLIWITSPAYAAAHDLGGPGAEDLSHLMIWETRYARHGVDVHEGGLARHLPLPRKAMRVNDPICVREAVIGGMGVSFLPERYCIGALADGRLQQVWPHLRFDREAARLALLYPGSKLLSPRFRAVAGFLEEICAR